MRVFSVLMITLLLSGYLHGQSPFCMYYALVTKNVTTDTLKVTHLNGNTFNQVNRVSTGQTSYRSLKLKDKPAENYAIYNDNSYRMIPDVQIKEYMVTVLGKEKIGAYNCTKISVVTFQNGGLSYMWISDEVPDYKNYLGASVIDFKLDRLAEALKKKNLAGIPVKIAYKVPDYISYELVKAGPCEVDASLFDLNRYSNSKVQNQPK